MTPTNKQTPRPGQRSPRSQSGWLAIWLRQAYAIAVVALVAGPVAAQEATYGDVTLPATGTATTSGRTGGGTSLPDAVVRSSHDPAGHECLGYGNVSPSHRLRVGADRPSPVTFSVESGDDTTLVIKGPGNFLLCGDDISPTNLNAQAIAPRLAAGTYEIWVGSMKRGLQGEYTLTVR